MKKRVEGSGGGESFKEFEYEGRNKVDGEEEKWRRKNV